MCKYYGKIEFTGCGHVVDASTLEPEERRVVDYCEEFGNAQLEADPTGRLHGRGRVNHFTSWWFKVHLNTSEAGLPPLPRGEPCDVVEYEADLVGDALMASSAVPAEMSLGPVCVECGRQKEVNDREWAKILLLLRKVNNGVTSGAFKNEAATLPNGAALPKFLRDMPAIDADVIAAMEHQQELALSQSLTENVFRHGGLELLKYFQRLTVHRTLHMEELPFWDERLSCFGVDSAGWVAVANTFTVLLSVQNMGGNMVATDKWGRALRDVRMRVRPYEPRMPEIPDKIEQIQKQRLAGFYNWRDQDASRADIDHIKHLRDVVIEDIDDDVESLLPLDV